MRPDPSSWRARSDAIFDKRYTAAGVHLRHLDPFNAFWCHDPLGRKALERLDSTLVQDLLEAGQPCTFWRQDTPTLRRWGSPVSQMVSSSLVTWYRFKSCCCIFSKVCCNRSWNPIFLPPNFLMVNIAGPVQPYHVCISIYTINI